MFVPSNLLPGVATIFPSVLTGEEEMAASAYFYWTAKARGGEGHHILLLTSFYGWGSLMVACSVSQKRLLFIWPLQSPKFSFPANAQNDLQESLSLLPCFLGISLGAAALAVPLRSA